VALCSVFVILLIILLDYCSRLVGLGRDYIFESDELLRHGLDTNIF